MSAGKFYYYESLTAVPKLPEVTHWVQSGLYSRWTLRQCENHMKCRRAAQPGVELRMVEHPTVEGAK